MSNSWTNDGLQARHDKIFEEEDGFYFEEDFPALEEEEESNLTKEK